MEHLNHNLVGEAWINYEKEKSIKAVRMFIITFLIMSLFWLVIIFSVFVDKSSQKTGQKSASKTNYDPVDMSIISTIESNNNPYAYNHRSNARGQYQITPICLKDFNQYNQPQYTPEDLFDPEINKKISEWYLYQRIPQLLNHFNKQDNLENTLIAYNCGIGCVGKPLPKETENYIKKYKSMKGKL